MKDIEFVKEVLGLLDEEDYRLVYNQACSRGFTVPGFSNKKRTNNIPIALITRSGVLQAKGRRDKYNYEILLEAMKSVALEKNDKNSILYDVKIWCEDTDSHEEIEKRINEIEKNNNDAYKLLEMEDVKEEINIEKKICNDLEKKNLQLENEIEKLKEKVKKYKDDLQHNKIQIGQLKEENGKLTKECEKLNNKNETLNQKFEKQVSEHALELEKASNVVSEQKKEIEWLNKQIEELQQYKDVAPKILCFTKESSRIMLAGYDICFMSCVDELTKECIDVCYDEIWYVRKGFNHADLIYIKELFPEKEILQARNEIELMEKVAGGKK